MNKLIIYEYINRLKKEDIIVFCNKRNIVVTDNDINIIYSYVKNDYKRFFSNPDSVIKELKNKVSNNAYNELMNLYDKYKYLI
jgi:hypothetical protein